MAKFYQTRETQGIYEAVPNRLTVNQYDRVLIGFNAVSPKELQDTTVDASDVVVTRYAINPTTIELNIDTTTPRTFTLTATQEVMMSATPKDMTKPLEVVVRRPTYLHKPAVGQQRDPAACWAACLSYWLSVAPGRDDRSFVNILGDFNGLWDSVGLIRVDQLQSQIATQHVRYRMATETIVPNRLAEFVGRWPLLIAFHHPAGFGHMNVLTTYDWSNDLVRAMDPWSPEPPPNSLERSANTGGQLIFNGTEGDFRFVGIFAFRPLAYYQSPLRGLGTIFVGYPQEYRNRMP